MFKLSRYKRNDAANISGVCSLDQSQKSVLALTTCFISPVHLNYLSLLKKLGLLSGAGCSDATNECRMKKVSTPVV